jgi:hypothetical protein
MDKIEWMGWGCEGGRGGGEGATMGVLGRKHLYSTAYVLCEVIAFSSQRLEV